MASSYVQGAGRRADKRQHILNVACGIFFEEGFGATSMSSIAERVGGSKGTLYNYFRSKEELFRAVVQRKGVELYEELNLLPDRPGELRTYLTQFGHSLLKIIATDRYIAFYRLIIAEAARFPMIGTDEYESRRQLVLGRLGERFHEEMRAGRLRVSDHLEAAEVFWNLCSASIHRRVLLAPTAPRVSDDEVGHIVDRAVTIFFAAFGLETVHGLQDSNGGG